MNNLFGVLLMAMGSASALIGALTLFFFPWLGVPCLLGGLVIMGLGGIVWRLDNAFGAVQGLAEILAALRDALNRDRY